MISNNPYNLSYIQCVRFRTFLGVIVRDTNDVSLIRFVNRLSIPARHSPIF